MRLSVTLLVCAVALSAGTSLCSAFTPDGVPEQPDWRDVATILDAGREGSWDAYLWGGFANSLIKKDGVFFLYYQGSAFYDEACDSVAARAIGVATSRDGVTWTKYPGNPIITWSTAGGSVEEGAASSGAWLDADGTVYLYYGANSGTGCNIAANIRLAKSRDGLLFEDLGEVLSGKDPTVWGAGDEIFPLGALSHNGQWALYYVANGVDLSRRLGVALGSDPVRFTKTASVNMGRVAVWGPVSAVITELRSLLFVNSGTRGFPVAVFALDTQSPDALSYRLQYRFADCVQSSVIHDATDRTWYAACRTENSTRYILKAAGPTRSRRKLGADAEDAE